jgi:hypothetical protein
MALEFDIEEPIVFDVEIEPSPVIDVEQGIGEKLGIVLLPGLKGLDGQDGQNGQKGDPGEPGNSFGVTAWWSGHGEPVGIVGAKPGDYYTDLDTGLVYKLGD